MTHGGFSLGYFVSSCSTHTQPLPPLISRQGLLEPRLASDSRQVCVVLRSEPRLSSYLLRALYHLSELRLHTCLHKHLSHLVGFGEA